MSLMRKGAKTPEFNAPYTFVSSLDLPRAWSHNVPVEVQSSDAHVLMTTSAAFMSDAKSPLPLRVVKTKNYDLSVAFAPAQGDGHKQRRYINALG